MIRWSLAILLLSAASALAAGTLEGRMVMLNVLTYDDAVQPILESKGRTVVVGDGVDFGMGREFIRPDFDVVPVQVEIGPRRIEFSYGAIEGFFFEAAFNGYVLQFAVDCALFRSVRIDEAATTMPVTLADIRTEGGALFVNVAGRFYGPQATIALEFEVDDCLLG